MVQANQEASRLEDRAGGRDAANGDDYVAHVEEETEAEAITSESKEKESKGKEGKEKK